MLVSVTRAELTVVGNTQTLGKSSSTPETAYTVSRQTDTVQKTPTHQVKLKHRKIRNFCSNKQAVSERADASPQPGADTRSHPRSSGELLVQQCPGCTRSAAGAA